MIPILTYPLALLGLVTIPSLVAVYLLHNRYRRRTVSALFLWESVSRRRQGGRHVRRVQTPLLFFLELLALGALILAAIDPRWLGRGRGRQLAVILDCSVSMQARAGGSSARDRAIEDVVRIAGRRGTSTVQLVAAGATPRLLGPPVRPAQLRGSLDVLWACRAPKANVPAALALVSELPASRGGILVVSDRVDPAVPPRDGLMWVAVGRAVANLAVTHAARSAGPAGEDRCLFEVTNFSGRPAAAALAVRSGRGEAGQVSSVDVSVAAGSRRRVELRVPGAVPLVTATLPDDALGADNTAWLLPPPRRRVRVRTQPADDDAARTIRRALTATDRASFGDGAAQLLISAAGDGSPTASQWVCHLHSSAETTTYTAPFLVDQAHPLGRGLDLAGVLWAADPAADLPGTPVVMAGGAVLVSTHAAAGGRVVHLNLTMAGSSLPTHPSWPILLWNLLDWRGEALPGFRRTALRLGETTRLLLPPLQPPGASLPEPVTVTHAGGETELPVTEAGVALFTPPAVGLFALRDQPDERLACNLLSGAESDLRGATTTRLGALVDDAAVQRDFVPTAWLFGLLALLLLLAHTYLSGPRGGG